MLLALQVACSGGGGSGGSSDVPEFVSISGTITYDRVPFSLSALAGLDFNNIQRLPARGVSVQLLDGAGIVFAVANTDGDGVYTFAEVPSNQLFRVRVLAILSKTSSPSWDVRVLDHTSGNAQYVLNGVAASSGERDSIRNLHANSGWDNSLSSYVDPRAAAPFAILDSIYIGLQRLAAIDEQLRLDDLQIFWSPNNNTAIDSFEQGDIGNTFYRNQQIYVLGQEDSDTDEYDQHVLLHEWAHFIEDSVSRSDTIGGSHDIVESLDSRLAFAEGFANAFSGMVTDDSVYRDSFGDAQSRDFFIDVEVNPNSSNGDNAGWFVESSIHSLLYDFYDANNEGDDAIAAGLQPIYDVLTDSDYVSGSALHTIYPFIERFRSHPMVDSAIVGQLLAAQNISGLGPYGLGETNDGGDPGTLPVYLELTVNDSSKEVCTTNGLSSREVNKLGNRRFLRFTAVEAEHTISVWYSGTGFTPSNPALILYRRGQVVRRVPRPGTPAYEVEEDSVNLSRNLSAGEYIVEVFSRVNVDGDRATGGDVCFNVAVNS